MNKEISSWTAHLANSGCLGRITGQAFRLGEVIQTLEDKRSEDGVSARVYIVSFRCSNYRVVISDHTESVRRLAKLNRAETCFS